MDEHNHEPQAAGSDLPKKVGAGDIAISNMKLAGRDLGARGRGLVATFDVRVGVVVIRGAKLFQRNRSARRVQLPDNITIVHPKAVARLLANASREYDALIKA